MATDNRPGGPIATAVATLMLPLFYVMSIGPFFRLQMTGYIDDSWDIVYAPIALICSKNEVLGAMLLWYLNFWLSL